VRYTHPGLIEQEVDFLPCPVKWVHSKCSPDIFFRVINARRCPSYFQYKEGALKQALKER